MKEFLKLALKMSKKKKRKKDNKQGSVTWSRQKSPVGHFIVKQSYLTCCVDEHTTSLATKIEMIVFSCLHEHDRGM